MFGLAPTEKDIVAKMQALEAARTSGNIFPAEQMDAAGQEALKRLMSGNYTSDGRKMPSIDKPVAAQQQPLQQPQQGGSAYAAAPGAQNYTRTPQMAPPQGGAWADAEAEQRRQALAGVPTVR